MASEFNEALQFVLCVEEHPDVLIKSQVREQKQKKNDAAEKIINKWKNMSGQTLNQASMLKKIHNMKSRAKAVLNSRKPLNEWQNKILLVGGADPEPDGDILPITNASTNGSSNGSSMNELSDGTNGLSAGEQVLIKYETDETKLLTNVQLQRFVLLKQVELISLHKQRYERLHEQHETPKDIVFDFVGFEVENPSLK